MKAAPLFTVSASGLAQIALDAGLTPQDKNVLLLIMAEHERGAFNKGTRWLAEILKTDIANIRKCCLKLEKSGYIVREIGPTGAIDNMFISPWLMFMGRRNQEKNRMREEHTSSIKYKRQRYYERLANDPTDYPNYGKAVWPGSGPGGTDWVYKGDSDGKAEDSGSKGEDR